MSDCNNVPVRKATHEDLPWVLKELKVFANHFQSEIHIYGGDEQIGALCEKLIDQHLFLVYEDEELGPIGFITGQISNHLYNENISVLYELAWWTMPEYRGRGSGEALMDAFTKWGEANVNWTIFSLQHNTPVKEDALTKKGYRLLEKVYVLEREF